MIYRAAGRTNSLRPQARFRVDREQPHEKLLLSSQVDGDNHVGSSKHRDVGT
jgi:hypothetical protein